MDFFGITFYGPRNYIADLIKTDYSEPISKEDVEPLMKIFLMKSTCPESDKRPDIDTIRYIDCYIGEVNGFAYGSIQRFNKMKRKGVIKAVGPADIYILPPTTSIEYGWWLHDPDLGHSSWHKTYPRHPQPSSPNTLILDKVRKNNKYATLF